MSAITTGVGLAIAGTVGAVGAIGGGLISANAAGNAANTQANAATQAAQIQANSAQQALDFQRQQFNTQQNNIAPWLGVGRGALANLAYLYGIPMSGMTIPGTGTPGTPSTTTSGTWQAADGSTLDSGQTRTARMLDNGGVDSGATFTPGETIPGTPGTPDTSLSSLVNPNLGAFGSLQFTPPTAATEQNDPGYQFRLNEGMKLVDQGAAARGALETGGTAKAEQQYAQDYASNEYQNTYSRELNNYLTKFNSLSSLAGLGTQANTQLASAGQNFANNSSTIAMNNGNNQAAGINNAAAARASGYVGAGNAFASGLGGATSNLSQLALLNSIYGSNGAITSPLQLTPSDVNNPLFAPTTDPFALG